MEQSAFAVHAATQRPVTHEVPFEHCALLVHFGFGVQRPEVHEHDELQSLFPEQLAPGHPKVQSSSRSS